MRRTIVSIVVCLLFFVPVSFADVSDELAVGRNYTRLFFDNEISPIWNKMTDQMQNSLGSEAALQEFHTQVQTQIGSEKSIVDERLDEVKGLRVYVRRSLFDKTERPIVISWAFDDKDRIAGFFIRPEQIPAKSSYMEYETRAKLQLPFYGKWYVV